MTETCKKTESGPAGHHDRLTAGPVPDKKETPLSKRHVLAAHVRMGPGRRGREKIQPSRVGSIPGGEWRQFFNGPGKRTWGRFSGRPGERPRTNRARKPGAIDSSAISGKGPTRPAADWRAVPRPNGGSASGTHDCCFHCGPWYSLGPTTAKS